MSEKEESHHDFRDIMKKRGRRRNEDIPVKRLTDE
jgi:hypothetical protein